MLSQRVPLARKHEVDQVVLQKTNTTAKLPPTTDESHEAEFPTIQEL